MGSLARWVYWRDGCTGAMGVLARILKRKRCLGIALAQPAYRKASLPVWASSPKNRLPSHLRPPASIACEHSLDNTCNQSGPTDGDTNADRDMDRDIAKASSARGTRTPDQRIRNPLLYPTELWHQKLENLYFYPVFSHFLKPSDPIRIRA